MYYFDSNRTIAYFYVKELFENITFSYDSV